MIRKNWAKKQIKNSKKCEYEKFEEKKRAKNVVKSNDAKFKKREIKLTRQKKLRFVSEKS